MFGGLLHHQLAHLHPAGEEDIVEVLLQQGLVLRPASLHHRDILRGETGLHQLPEGRRGGGVGRGLQNAAVARGNGPDEGLQGEENGVVPGGHDEGHPVGPGQGEALARKEGHGGENPFGFGPAAEVLFHIGQL